MIKVIAIAIIAVLMVGCQHAGLSPRETQTQNYATYIMSLYDAPATPAVATGIVLPARVAVAQVGEVAPPAKMLAAMRADPAFARVEPVPGYFAEDYSGNYQERQARVQEQIRQQVTRMRRFSSDLGMNYLFIFGGSIDYDTHSNPLSVLDWTIIGAYVVPGKNVKAQGRAAGALIDLATGRVMFVTSAEAEKECLSSTASSDGQEQRLLGEMREEMIAELGKKMAGECRLRAGIAVPAAAPVLLESGEPQAGWRPAN